MRRREIIAALGGAVAWPLAGRATATVPVVGLLYAGPSSYPGLAAFEKGMSDLGAALP
jgi:hypothetical protein